MPLEVDPSSDLIWRSVSSRATIKGRFDQVPKNDKEWQQVRDEAVILGEAANLLMTPGRRAARFKCTRGAHGPLDVAAIDKRLTSNPYALPGFAAQMAEVARRIIDAADRRDTNAITDLGGQLDAVCESCHKLYWYPDEP